MPVIGIAPIVLKDTLFTIVADNYERNVSKVEFSPSASMVTWKGLSPAAMFTDIGLATWDCTLDYAQDWETPGSLAQYLFANEGTTKAATFRPRSGFGPTFNANLVITPGAIGGAVDSVAVASVTLGCSGRPTLVPISLLPIVSGASVTSGPIAGGNQVAITGQGFTSVTAFGAAGVKFGTVNATSYVVISDTLIVAIAPAQAVGAKNITVTNAAGVSVASAPYTYV